MDNSVQEQYIQKRLLYQYDRKVETVYSEYLKLRFPSELAGQAELSREKILQQIQSLQFQNWKYRAALLSANKDIVKNEGALTEEENRIQKMKAEIEFLLEDLKRAQISKRHKQEFNEIGKTIMSFGKRAVEDQRIAAVQREIQQLQTKYDNDSAIFSKRERYLKNSLSSLKGFFHEMKISEATVAKPFSFAAAAEDDGLIE